MKKEKRFHKIRSRRVRRVRAKIFGTSARPRLAIARSNRFTSAQLVDDEAGKTLAAVSTRALRGEEKKKNKAAQALLAGELLGKRAAELGVKQAVCDRRQYKYHGRVKAFAEGVKKFVRL